MISGELKGREQSSYTNGRNAAGPEQSQPQAGSQGTSPLPADFPCMSTDYFSPGNRKHDCPLTPQCNCIWKKEMCHLSLQEKKKGKKV